MDHQIRQPTPAPEEGRGGDDPDRIIYGMSHSPQSNGTLMSSYYRRDCPPPRILTQFCPPSAPDDCRGRQVGTVYQLHDHVFRFPFRTLTWYRVLFDNRYLPFLSDFLFLLCHSRLRGYLFGKSEGMSPTKRFHWRMQHNQPFTRKHVLPVPAAAGGNCQTKTETVKTDVSLSHEAVWLSACPHSADATLLGQCGLIRLRHNCW